MRDFHDKVGRTWQIQIDPAFLRQARVALGVDLFAADSGIATLRLDPLLAANALWLLCRGQAEAAGVAEAEFYAGLDLPAITRGRRCVCFAVLDFLDLDRLPEEISEAAIASVMADVMLRDPALGSAAHLGIAEMPPPEDLRVRFLDLAATLRGAADHAEALALFADLEAVERSILARRQRWRRDLWLKRAALLAPGGDT